MRHTLAAILLLAVAIGRSEGVVAGGRPGSDPPPEGGEAQQPRTFNSRLSPVPISVDRVTRITGSGSVTAVLTATTLALTGSFSGLQSPATVARIHVGERKGVRGPAVFDLTVSNATSGSISGSIELTAAQADGLSRGLLYVQLHSEKAPEGNLWGWLLPAEDGR